MDFYLDQLLDENDIEDYEGRRNILNQILPLLKQMTPSRMDFYVKKVAGSLNIKEQFLYDELANVTLPSDHPVKQISSDSEKKGKSFPLDEIIIGILLEKKQFINEISDECKGVYKELLDKYNSSRNNLDSRNNKKEVSANLREKNDVLQLYVQEQYSAFSDEAMLMELKKLLDKALERRRNESLQRIHGEIKEAEKSQDKEKEKKLLEKLQKLLSGSYGKNK